MAGSSSRSSGSSTGSTSAGRPSSVSPMKPSVPVVARRREPVSASSTTISTSTCIVRWRVATTRAARSTSEPTGTGARKLTRSERTTITWRRLCREAAIAPAVARSASAAPPNRVPWWFASAGPTSSTKRVTGTSAIRAPHRTPRRGQARRQRASQPAIPRAVAPPRAARESGVRSDRSARPRGVDDPHRAGRHLQQQEASAEPARPVAGAGRRADERAEPASPAWRPAGASTGSRRGPPPRAGAEAERRAGAARWRAWCPAPGRAAASPTRAAVPARPRTSTWRGVVSTMRPSSCGVTWAPSRHARASTVSPVAVGRDEPPGGGDQHARAVPGRARVDEPPRRRPPPVEAVPPHDERVAAPGQGDGAGRSHAGAGSRRRPRGARGQLATSPPGQLAAARGTARRRARTPARPARRRPTSGSSGPWPAGHASASAPRRGRRRRPGRAGSSCRRRARAW